MMKNDKKDHLYYLHYLYFNLKYQVNILIMNNEKIDYLYFNLKYQVMILFMNNY